MKQFTSASFREDDTQLFQTGNFADGTVKCKDRTWKVHRALLASRLKFFKAAFYGSSEEAISAELDFPESDPDLVDIMLRHLYRQDLDVKDLKTPAICVRCWRLADYVQLETLKKVAVSSLGQHLDAMALLASSSYWDYGPKPTPKWLSYLLEGLREVCRYDTTKPIHTMFTTFLWVTRFELLTLPETLDSLKKSREVNRQLTDLLIFEELDDDNWSDWIDVSIPSGREYKPRDYIARRNFIYFDRGGCCTYCKRPVEEEDLLFYNPFPIGHWKVIDIGDEMYCKRCATEINEQCDWSWRWRTYRRYDEHELKLEAWTWSDDE